MGSRTQLLMEKILGCLERMEEKHDKQWQTHSQEIKSIKAAVLSHGGDIQSLHQQLSRLTSPIASYRQQPSEKETSNTGGRHYETQTSSITNLPSFLPNKALSQHRGSLLDGQETADIRNKFSQQMIEMRRLFQEELQLLRGEVKEAQNNIQKQLLDLNQESKKMTGFQNTLNNKVQEVGEKLERMEKRLKEKIEENAIFIKARLDHINGELATNIRMRRNLPGQLLHDKQKSTASSSSQDLDKRMIGAVNDVVSKMIAHQTDNIKRHVTEKFAQSRHEIDSKFSKIDEQIESTSEEIKRSLNPMPIEEDQEEQYDDRYYDYD